jgi:hypothetical protein
MSGAIDANAKPLPVVLKSARDELLSSWLARHARFYGITGRFFAKWLGLGDVGLSAFDYRLGLEQVAQLTEKFRCDPVTLIGMTQIDPLDGQVCRLISRGKPPQICYRCADRFAQDGAEGAVPKHWSKAWRITCPACGLAFTDTNEHRGSRATLLETTPFEDLWSEAVAGEEIVERYLAHEKPAEHSPIAVMQLLLVQTWKPITPDQENPVVGWVLGTLFPDFDARARPIGSGKNLGVTELAYSASFDEKARSMTAQLEMKVWVELCGADGEVERRQVMSVARDVDQAQLKDFGLALAEGKRLQEMVQRELTRFQVEQAVRRDRFCVGCARRRGIHDYRPRSVHTLFGISHLRLPRLRACACGRASKTTEDRSSTLLAGRATPELERIQAELGARHSFREAARMLDLFSPATQRHNHRTVSNHLAKVAGQIEKWDVASPHRMSRASGGPVSVFIDGAYIRALPGYQTRHFEIVMGCIETNVRNPRHFAATPHVATSGPGIVNAALRSQGWMPGRDVTVFGDGDPSLKATVMSATREPVTHILDWFHLSMRLRHIEQAWEGICANEHELKYSLATTFFDVPRLRHLLWSGYVREATDAIKGILYELNSVLDVHTHAINAKMKRCFQLISEILTYLNQNSASMVDYCRRYWSDRPISSSRAEATVNMLVNARMNKKQQMRWSPGGAHRVLQVRAAVIDGRLQHGAQKLAA